MAAQQQNHATQEFKELAGGIHCISEENARDAHAPD